MHLHCGHKSVIYAAPGDPIRCSTMHLTFNWIKKSHSFQPSIVYLSGRWAMKMMMMMSCRKKVCEVAKIPQCFSYNTFFVSWSSHVRFLRSIAMLLLMCVNEREVPLHNSRAQHSSPSWYISSWLLRSVSCFFFSYTGSCVSSLLARSSRQRSMTGRSNRQVEVMLKVINYFYTMSRRLERGWRCLHGTKWLLS